MADFPKPTLDDWRELASKDLKGKPLETLDWETPEGIRVKPLYTAADLEGLEHLNTLPGFAPFVRGLMDCSSTNIMCTGSAAISWLS